jgi:hypothetical protein
VSQLLDSQGFVARHPLPFFVVLPVITLAVIVIASGAAEIALDHFIFGRAANGIPLLYTLPWTRNLIAGWNLTLVYVAPVLIAVAVWKIGSARKASATWLIVGGSVICVVGGVHYIEAVWTGIKGTSGLRIGPVHDLPTAATRSAANLAVFVSYVFLSKGQYRVA